MAHRYTEEQLNLQEQTESLTKEVHELNNKMQLMLEQLVLAKKDRFGRSSEKMEDAVQIRFMEVDGNIVFFNEAEAVCDLDAPEPETVRQERGRSFFPEGEHHRSLSL